MKKRKMFFLLAIFLLALTPIFKVNAVDTKVEIAKYDEDGKTLLSGAVLQILDEDNKVVEEWTTDEKLKDITTSVTPNTKYKIHEVTPPKGYRLSDDVEFTVDENEEQTYSITNNKIKLIVNKVDDEGNNISGALLELYEVGNNEAIDSWYSTDKGHEVNYELLEYGKTYRLVETKVPVGYIANELTKEFTINNDEVNETGNFVINFVNRELNIRIANYGEEGTRLAGVNLQIEDSAGNIVEGPWDSSETSHSVEAKLEKGKTYKIVEVSVPNGYVLKDAVEFTVSDNLQQEYSIQNNKFSVTISTIDQNDQPVSNVKYKIFDTEGNKLIENVSDGKEYSLTADDLIKFEYGKTYKLVAQDETTGYNINTDEQEFTIDSESVKINSVHTKVAIKIAKYDEDNITPLAGAKLQILDSEGNVVENEWTTTTSEHELKALLEKNKVYKIREISAPNGYVKSEDVEFTVTDDTVQTYSIKNERIKISVLKTDEYDEPLAGALLQLIEKDGSETIEIDSWVSTTEAYEIPFEKLKNIDFTKEHYLRETQAPTGYTKITEDEEIVIDETSELQRFKLSNNQSSFTISIRKYQNGTNSYVVGAKLELYEGEEVNPNKLVYTWTTSGATNFSTVSNDSLATDGTPILKYGRTYTIHEVEAPVGYALAADQSFTLKDLNKNTFINYYGTKVNLSVTKKNESDEFIAGAKLELKDGESVLHSWTTGDEKYTIPASVVSSMYYDKEYTIHEVESPVGYAVASDINFKFSDYNTENVEINMTDKKFSINVSTLNSENDHLANATLHIEDESGHKIGDEWETTDEVYNVPEGILNQMYYGKTYYIVETVSPTGYAIPSEPKEFTIDKEVVDVSLYNFKMGINIINYDEDGQALLNDTTLQLIDNETGDSLEEWNTTLSNPHKVESDLTVGNEYSIRIKNPKKGYIYADNIEFEAKSDLTQSYSITNKKVKLSFLKVGKDNQPLAGAKLYLYEESNDEAIAEWESDTTAYVLTEEENAKIDVTKNYYLIEAKAPTGYIQIVDYIPITIENNKSELQEIRIENELKTVKVNVKAVDKADDTDLSDVELELYNGTDLTEENKIEGWTTDDSTKEFSTTGEDAKLVYGNTYTLHVKSIPNGYMPIDDIEFTIDDSFDLETTFNIELERFNIKISKTGKDNNLIAGATLQILSSDGTIIKEFITTEDVYVADDTVLNKIKYGNTIKIREVKAPAGYVKSSEVKSIEINQKDNEIEFANIEFGINIINYDEDGSTYLAGTKLQILDESKENVLEEWTTTEEEQVHSINAKLNEGSKYYIHVETPSNGYIKAEDKSFTVTNETSQVYDIKNEKFNIAIIKVDNDKQPLAGALLSLYEEGNDAPIESWVSEEEAFVLPTEVLSKMNITKNYFIRETKAPTGYETLDVDMFIPLKNETELQTFEIENSLKQYDIVIDVVDEGQNNISGAEIELYDGDIISDDKLIDSWVSTDDSIKYSTIEGRFSTQKLEYGKTYTIHVVKTPSGKTIESNHTFTIDENSEEVTNIKIVAEKYSIFISKLDENGNPLAGAKMKVIYGTYEHEFTTTTEPYPLHDNLEEEIPYGSTIKLIEVEAPEGYVKSSEEKIIEINKNLINIEFANVKLGVNIINYDEDGITYLSGTTLQILDESKQNVIEEWTTTEEEPIHTINAKLKEGNKYYIYVKVPSNGHILPLSDEEQEFGYVDFTIDNRSTQEYSIVNPKFKLEVVKKDEDGNMVDGALLCLKELGTDNELHRWVSSSSKAESLDAVIDQMSINKSYIVEEITPPVAYQDLTDSENRTPLLLNNTADLQQTIVINKLKRISLSIQKVDANNIALSGAKLQLYAAKKVDDEYVIDGDVIAEWTDANKIFTTTTDPRIKYGKTYIIHEEKAPNGYVKAKDIVVTIEGEDGSNIPVKMVDELLNVKVENIINGKETSGTLAGAELELYKGTDTSNKDNLVESWTSSSDPHVIQALLEAGATYTIHEVSVPNGYDVSSDVSFTVKDTKDEQIYTMVTNEHELDVRVIKYNEEGEVLAGAKFELYTTKEEDGKLVKDKKVYEWTSKGANENSCDANNITEECGYHKIPVDLGNDNSLHVGNYIIHEAVYPIPYQPQTEETIDTLITVNLDSKPQLWSILNRKTITTVVVNKVDRNCSGENDTLCHITGANLYIKDENGNKVHEWTSNGEPHKIDNILVPGKRYTLVEANDLVDANQAYQKSEDLDLGVIQNIEETQTFTMYTDKTIVNAIIYHKDENGKHLADGTYRLYEGEFGSSDPINILPETPCEKEQGCVVEWDTSKDEDAHDISEYVRPGYTYTIIQTKVPYGYKPYDSVLKIVGKDEFDNDKQERVNSSIITINNITYDKNIGSGVQSFDIINEKKDITIYVNNFGSDGMPTYDVNFELLAPEGNVVDTWSTNGIHYRIKNGQEGNYKFKVGETYTIHQLSVTEGYLIDEEYYSVEIGDTEEGRTIDIENSKLLTLVVNVIDEKNQFLPGVTMQILDKDGNVKAEWKTTNGPHNIVNLPAPSTYIVRQKAVPNKYAKESDQYILLDPLDDYPYVTLINYEKKVLDNPETLDNIIKYVIIGVASLFAFIVGIFVYKKLNKSKG